MKSAGKAKQNAKNLLETPDPLWREFHDDVFETNMKGFRATMALLTSVDLGLFDQTEKPATAKKISKALETDETVTAMLCDALSEMGLLTKDGEKYVNTPGTRHYLTSGSPYSQTDNLGRMERSIARWYGLEKYVRDGQKVLPMEKYFNKRWIKSIAEGSKGGSVAEAIKYLEKHIDLSKIGTATDLGGGHGLYMIGLRHLCPHIEARVFDRKAMLDVARKYSKSYGVDIVLVPGDFYENDLPTGNDLLFASFNPACSDHKLVPKISAALNPGGYLVVKRHNGKTIGDALTNMEWNLDVWEGHDPKKKRFHAATEEEDKYVGGLAKAGIRLVRKDDFDRTSEILVFRRDA